MSKNLSSGQVFAVAGILFAVIVIIIVVSYIVSCLSRSRGRSTFPLKLVRTLVRNTLAFAVCLVTLMVLWSCKALSRVADEETLLKVIRGIGIFTIGYVVFSAILALHAYFAGRVYFSLETEARTQVLTDKELYFSPIQEYSLLRTAFISPTHLPSIEELHLYPSFDFGYYLMLSLDRTFRLIIDLNAFTYLMVLILVTIWIPICHVLKPWEKLLILLAFGIVLFFIERVFWVYSRFIQERLSPIIEKNQEEEPLNPSEISISYTMLQPEYSLNQGRARSLDCRVISNRHENLFPCGRFGISLFSYGQQLIFTISILSCACLLGYHIGDVIHNGSSWQCILVALNLIVFLYIICGGLPALSRKFSLITSIEMMKNRKLIQRVSLYQHNMLANIYQRIFKICKCLLFEYYLQTNPEALRDPNIQVESADLDSYAFEVDPKGEIMIEQLEDLLHSWGEDDPSEIDLYLFLQKAQADKKGKILRENVHLVLQFESRYCEILPSIIIKQALSPRLGEDTGRKIPIQKVMKILEKHSEFLQEGDLPLIIEDLECSGVVYEGNVTLNDLARTIESFIILKPK